MYVIFNTQANLIILIQYIEWLMQVNFQSLFTQKLNSCQNQTRRDDSLGYRHARRILKNIISLFINSKNKFISQFQNELLSLQAQKENSTKLIIKQQ
jgi:hypothetical protein